MIGVERGVGDALFGLERDPNFLSGSGSIYVELFWKFYVVLSTCCVDHLIFSNLKHPFLLLIFNVQSIIIKKRDIRCVYIYRYIDISGVCAYIYPVCVYISGMCVPAHPA